MSLAPSDITQGDIYFQSRFLSHNWKKDSGVLVALPRSSDVLTSVLLVLLPYSNDGAIDGVL